MPALIQNQDGVRPVLQKRSREKLLAMIKAGNRLIEEHGYEGTKISDIAKEAGCSVGSFYERFQDKEHFFQLLLSNNADRSTETLSLYLAPENWSDKTVGELMTALVESNVAWFRNHKGLYCAAMSTQMEGGRNHVPFQKQSVHQAECLLAILKPRASELGCEDVEAAVWFVVQMIGGVLVQAAFSDAARRAGSVNSADKRLTFDNPELAKKLTNSVCAYLGVSIHGGRKS